MSSDSTTVGNGRTVRISIGVVGVLPGVIFALGLCARDTSTLATCSLFVAAFVLGAAVYPWIAARWRRKWVTGIAVCMSICCLGCAAFVIWGYHYALPKQLRFFAQDHMRLIGASLSEYLVQHGRYPDSLGELVEMRIATTELLHSPLQSNRRSGVSDYAYVTGLSQDDPPNWPLVFERKGIHTDGLRTVLCLSGVVRTVPEDQFDTAYADFERDFRTRKGHAPRVILDQN